MGRLWSLLPSGIAIAFESDVLLVWKMAKVRAAMPGREMASGTKPTHPRHIEPIQLGYHHPSNRI
jgi:hypothetical protein